MSGHDDREPRVDAERRVDAEQRFETELRRAARTFVTDELPRGVLDPAVGASLGLEVTPEGGVRSRRVAPGFAALAGAIAVLVLATAIAFAPASPGGTAPAPTPTPTPTPAPSVRPTAAAVARFRTTPSISLDLETLAYRCVEGRPIASIGPGPDAVARESAVCMAPEAIGPFMAAVIVGESATGDVVEVHAKADFTDGDTPAGRTAVASMLAKAAAISVPQGSGNIVGDWVSANVGALEPNDDVSTVLVGLTLELLRTSDGGYQLRVGLGATG